MDTYRYWVDEGLDIRTCKECKFTEVKSPIDGEWLLYLTQERIDYYFAYLISHNFKEPECKCSKLIHGELK